MIEEHGIDDLARRRRQPEADVAHAKNRFAFRQRRLDQPHTFDGLDRAADIILITCGAREHQRVENNVFLGDAVLDAVIAGALGNGQLALACNGLRLLLVLVNRPNDDCRAILLHQRQHLVECLLAILEIDRVDDAFAEAIRQRALDRLVIRCVDHERHFDLVNHFLVKPVDVAQLVAVGILEIDVDDVRAALDLRARNLSRFLEFLVRNQPLKSARANFVGAFANDQRAVVVRCLNEFDAAVPGLALRAEFARFLALDHLRDGLDVRRRRPATPADKIEPTIFDKPL